MAEEVKPGAAVAEPASPEGQKPDSKAVEGAQPANAWTEMMRAAGSMTEAVEAEEAEAGTEEKAAEKAGEKAGEKAPPAGAAPEGEKEEPEGERTEEKAEEERAPKAPAYSIVAPDGSEYEFDGWPEGAKFKFKADGRPVEATPEQLVEFAQKGVHADRRLTEFGQRERQLRTELTQRDARLDELHEELDSAWEILQSTLLEPDKEKRHDAIRKVLPVLRKYADPEVREALERQAREERESETTTEAEREEAIGTFWTMVGNEISATLKGETRPEEELEEGLPERPRFEFLTEDDLRDVVEAYHREYRHHAEALIEKYVGAAERAGADLEKAARLAEEHALDWLNESNLYAVMQGLDERYRKRVGPRRAKAAEQDGRREAETHNRTVERRLERRQTRTVRPGGAPPAGVTPERSERPTTWQDHMAGIRREFQKGREAGE